MEAALALIIGIVISMIYTWRMALITLGVSPLVSFGAVMMSRLQWKQKNRAEGSDEENDPYKKSNALLSDIIMNYRTVIAFGEKNVTYLMKGFGELLSEPNKEGIKKAHIAGFFFGYS
jgi:ATP-binding cassette subfamily B (MDR/TAP) protein 1